MRKVTPKTEPELVVFILTHGRANSVHTLTQLLAKGRGFSGRYYLICDTGDKQLEQYREKYGDKVLTFDKADYIGKLDTADNLPGTTIITYVRNACFDIAERMGIEYFIEFDDDYRQFRHRFNSRKLYRDVHILQLDKVFKALLDFYIACPQITSLAIAQSGDFIGGSHGKAAVGGPRLMRKAMNSFICSPSRRFEFVGRMNEDVNAYVGAGGTGLLFLTATNVSLTQTVTQQQAGGLTETYMHIGTFVKSFYSVIYRPDCVKIKAMGAVDLRLHHNIDWNCAVPRILREQHRKKAA
jgi:hypothetical protein